MPYIERDQVRVPALEVAVGPSIATELEWVLGYAGRKDWQADHPVIRRVYEERPDLVARVLDMWEPEQAVSCRGFMELMVLAHHGGLLLSADAETLLSRLPELCAAPPVDVAELPLITEDPGDRQAIHARLRRLHDSPDLAADYLRPGAGRVGGHQRRLGTVGSAGRRGRRGRAT